MASSRSRRFPRICCRPASSLGRSARSARLGCSDTTNKNDPGNCGGASDPAAFRLGAKISSRSLRSSWRVSSSSLCVEVTRRSDQRSSRSVSPCLRILQPSSCEGREDAFNENGEINQNYHAKEVKTTGWVVVRFVPRPTGIRLALCLFPADRRTDISGGYSPRIRSRLCSYCLHCLSR